MYEDGDDLTHGQIAYFLERMDSGEEVEADSDVHRLMTAAPERAMRITSHMNATLLAYRTPARSSSGYSCVHCPRESASFRRSQPTAA